MTPTAQQRSAQAALASSMVPTRRSRGGVGSLLLSVVLAMALALSLVIIAGTRMQVSSGERAQDALAAKVVAHEFVATFTAAHQLSNDPSLRAWHSVEARGLRPCAMPRSACVRVQAVVGTAVTLEVRLPCPAGQRCPAPVRARATLVDGSTPKLGALSVQ